MRSDTFDYAGTKIQRKINPEESGSVGWKVTDSMKRHSHNCKGLLPRTSLVFRPLSELVQALDEPVIFSREISVRLPL